MARDKKRAPAAPPKIRDVEIISMEEYRLAEVWTPPRDLVVQCKAPGCQAKPWPTFDGLCFDHGMFPETIQGN